MPSAGFLLLAVVCGGFPPEPPYTTRAVESGWGEPVDGLSIQIALDGDRVPLGAELNAEVFFRFVPFLAGPHPDRVLYTRTRGEVCELVFRSLDDGRERVREAYRASRIPPNLRVVRNLEAGLHSREDRFLLLTCEGESVPAGRYDAFIRYSNAGADPRGGRSPEQRPGDRPWSGMITTPPVRLTILPAEPETVSCRLPTAIVLDVHPETDRLAWDWDPESWRDVTVVRRPGYWLRVDWEDRVTLDGRDFPELSPDASGQARRVRREQYGFPRMSSGWWLHQGWGRKSGVAVLGPRFREVVRPGQPVHVHVNLALVQSPSRWLGCSDDHVLPAEWECEADAEWSPPATEDPERGGG